VARMRLSVAVLLVLPLNAQKSVDQPRKPEWVRVMEFPNEK